MKITFLRIKVFGVPRIFKESPQVKAITGVINLAVFLLKKKVKNEIKTVTAYPSPVGSTGFGEAKAFRAPAQYGWKHFPCYHYYNKRPFSNMS